MWLRALLAGACVLSVAQPAAAAAPKVLFRITDARIAEASGIAIGIASPGVAYVQNDSGDSARFFALDKCTGKTLATYTVPGATNVDWEDLAVARDRRGVASIWIADIGDNASSRSEIRLYRVDEPHVGSGDTTTASPDVWRLRYPDGPVDAESLAVAPGGAAYLFSKSVFGVTSAYAVPSRPDPSKVQALREIGETIFRPTGTPGGPNVIGQVTATGAAMSRDGSLLAIRTYTDAYVWPLRAGDVASALRSRPAHAALPEQPQGEGITIDGNRLLVDSERSGSDVFTVALPKLPAAPSGGVRASTQPPTPTRAAAGDSRSTSHGAVVVGIAGGAGVLLIVAISIAIRRRRVAGRRA